MRTAWFSLCEDSLPPCPSCGGVSGLDQGWGNQGTEAASQGGDSALEPRTALLPGELLGRLELAAGSLGVWLNPGGCQLVSCCHLCPDICRQTIGMEEREAGSRLGAAFTLKGPTVMPLEHFFLSGFGLCL